MRLMHLFELLMELLGHTSSSHADAASAGVRTDPGGKEPPDSRFDGAAWPAFTAVGARRRVDDRFVAAER